MHVELELEGFALIVVNGKLDGQLSAQDVVLFLKNGKNESAKTEGRWKNLYMSCCII